MWADEICGVTGAQTSLPARMELDVARAVLDRAGHEFRAHDGAGKIGDPGFETWGRAAPRESSAAADGATDCGAEAPCRAAKHQVNLRPNQRPASCSGTSESSRGRSMGER